MNISARIALTSDTRAYQAVPTSAAAPAVSPKIDNTSHSAAIIGNRIRLTPLPWADDTSKEAADSGSGENLFGLIGLLSGPPIGTRIGADIDDSSPRDEKLSTNSLRPPRHYFGSL